MKKYLFIILILNSFEVFAQQNLQEDNLQHTTLSKDDSPFRLRFGAGFQKTKYAELGISLKEISQGCSKGMYSKGLYTAVEYNQSNDKDIYGLKLGYEANLLILNLGVETKYLTDFKNNNFVITPKIGIGYFGAVNLSYGYNVSIKTNPFKEIGNHQISLIFDLGSDDL